MEAEGGVSLRLGRFVRIGAIAGAFFMLTAQFVPYGRDHINPPVVSEPAWSSEQARELATRACFDCHSNETQWPWYSNIAPMSWLVQRDVDEGRDELNWSEWEKGEEDGEDMIETVLEGEMPPGRYELAHPEARLTDGEMEELLQGLAATFPVD